MLFLSFTIMFSALRLVFYCYDNDSRPVLFFIVTMMISALCVFLILTMMFSALCVVFDCYDDV